MRKFFSLITALVLCTAMWGAAKVSQTLYKVEGALYQGLNENFTGGTNIFVPNDSAAVFTSFDGQPADWYRSNSLQEGGEGTPSFTFQKGFGDYAPMQIRNYTGYGQNATKTKIDYIYGKAAYNGKTLVVGASGMNMMSMANGYYFRTEDSASTGDIGKCYADNKTANTYKSNSSYGTYMMYGNDFTHSTHGAVQAYEMVLDNPGEMYIDYVVLPIFGYPKDKNTTIDMMIPDGKTVTLKLYPLSAISKNADGKYSYTKESAPVATMTVDASAYTQDATSGYSYRGTLKFELDEPILMTKSFVARLTWDDGCNFGLITDYYNLQNYTTWYIFKDGKYYLWTGGGYNSSISYHATFPTLDKKDTKTAFNFASTGGSDNVAFMSNIDPADTKEFTIDFGGAEWISKTGITYSGGTYKKSGTNTLTFAVEANTGEAREATITLKHHGKVLTYTVSQEAAPAPVEPTYLYLKAGEVDYMKDGAVVYLYSWGGSSEADWSKFELIQNETTAKASMMLDRTGMKIVRFASGTTTPSWQGTIWNQTGDISVSSDFPEKVDMIELSAWDGATTATWSKYTKPAVITYADSVYYVAGNFTKWAAEMKKLPAEVELPADSALEFKQVLTRTILADGDSIGQDTTWYGQSNEGNKMTRESSAWTLDGGYNVLATTDIAGKYTFSINEKGEFVLGWPKEPVITYKDSVYYVAGNFTKWAAEMKKLPAEVELPADSALEFKQVLTRTILADGDSIGQDTTWYGQANEGNKMTRESSAWTLDGGYNVLATTDIAGKYTFSINEKGEFVLGWPEKPLPEVKYYAKNNWNGAEDWSWLEMSATDQENFYMLDSVVFGGTGVNINTKEEDADALYFAADKIVVLDDLDGLPGPIPPEPRRRDTIPYAPAHSGIVLEAPQLLAGDTIKLFFNAADSTLKAFIVGRPEQPQPAEVKYYVTGNAALCGEKAWDAQAIEMIDSTYTFTELAAGEYEMKITNGAWDPEGQSWGSAALSEECSAGVGDKDGNIHFIVETPNDVTVSIANGSVTVTGTFKQVATGITVNVTVPEGTPACFFYGEMSGNTFVEMTKVDETHYTIDFPKATSIGWGYKFVWENGNWSTCNADPEGDIKVEPVEGVINVEVKAWATAPGTEYKYTTYTEWQVKFGPAWDWVNMTKQEDGTFTVEAVWGNTGINIASGENPIKQDWYPLDDPALTVEEGVVEGGNVVISLTVVDDETVALNVKKGQEPATPDFGLLVNGTDYLAGTPEDKDTYTEYAVNVNLMVGEFVQLYDNVNKVAWTVTPEAIGFTDFDIHDNAYYIKQTGSYQFYIKIPKEGTESGLYVGFQGGGTNLKNLKAQDGKRYNILGQPVNETYRGIVIMNGQTYLQ